MNSFCFLILPQCGTWRNGSVEWKIEGQIKPILKTNIFQPLTAPPLSTQTMCHSPRENKDKM